MTTIIGNDTLARNLKQLMESQHVEVIKAMNKKIIKKSAKKNVTLETHGIIKEKMRVGPHGKHEELDLMKIVSGDDIRIRHNLYQISSREFKAQCSIGENNGNCKNFFKKLLKQNTKVQHLDINLNFDGGKFSTTLRLYRGNRGVLEVVVFTSYSMKNETDILIYVLATKRWPLSRIELENLNSNIPSEIGLCSLPKSTGSWFLKSERVQLKLSKGHTSETQLDLGSLSDLTEIIFKKRRRRTWD
ncbi:hypothetical protein RYX36_000368 [Vicia faba]